MNLQINCQPIKFGATYYEENNKRYCDVKINRLFHMKPCTEVATLASAEPNKTCSFYKGGEHRDVKSMIELILANLKPGTEITLEAGMDYPKDLFMEIADCFEKQ